MKVHKGPFVANNIPADVLAAAIDQAPCRVLGYCGPTTKGLAPAFPALQLADRTQYPLDGWRTEPCRPAL